MAYSKKELSEIEALLFHPVIEKLWAETLASNEDVATMFLREYNEMIKCIASDMKLIREGYPDQCKIIGSDLYDHISDVMIKGDKLFVVLKKGKEVTNPDEAKKDADKEKDDADTAF